MTQKRIPSAAVLFTFLSSALIGAAPAPAWSSAAKAVSGRVGSGGVSGYLPVGAAGSAGMGLSETLSAPRLGASFIPVLPVPVIPAQESSLRPAAVPAAAAARMPARAAVFQRRMEALLPHRETRSPATAPAPAANPRALSRKLGAQAVLLQPDLQAAGNLGSASAESANAIGSAVAAKAFGFSFAPRSASDGVNAADQQLLQSKLRKIPAHARLNPAGIAGRDWMVDPGTLFARAYAEAAAKAKGTLHFGEATINAPIRDGDHWKFNFYSIPQEGDAKAAMISVDFHRGGGWTASGGFYSEVRVYADVSLPADQPVFPISAETFKNAVSVAPEQALTLAQREAPAMRGGVSISLRAELEGENGERGDFQYRFYDDKGHEVSVNARSGEARLLSRPRMETREERLERFRTWKTLRDLDMWLGEHIPLYAFLKWAAIFGAIFFLLDMFFLNFLTLFK